MACEGCEQRRAEMLLMLEATKLWAQAPTGPNVHAIYLRLRKEAINKGELPDGIVRPHS